VVRVGLDPADTNQSEPIQADARQLPFDESVSFDLGLFHPPCQKWAVGSHVKGDPDKRHDNLIPVARDIAKRYCDEYIIENVPQAPLHDPVTLNGEMFGLPLHYERAFETSYHVNQPRQQTRLDKSGLFDKHHANGDWTGSVALWKSVKGYSRDYQARSLKREAVPRPYLNYLIRPLLAEDS
jgi:hypothetical protein